MTFVKIKNILRELACTEYFKQACFPVGEFFKQACFPDGVYFKQACLAVGGYFKQACLPVWLYFKQACFAVGRYFKQACFPVGEYFKQACFPAGLCEVELGSLDPVSGARLRATVCLILQESLLTLETALAQGVHRTAGLTHGSCLAVLGSFVSRLSYFAIAVFQGIVCVTAPSFLDPRFSY